MLNQIIYKPKNNSFDYKHKDIIHIFFCLQSKVPFCNPLKYGGKTEKLQTNITLFINFNLKYQLSFIFW